MDPQTAVKVLNEMRAGHRVAVVCESTRAARFAFIEVASEAQEGERVRRANGAERISSRDGRGWVIFGSAGSQARSFRGISVDTLVLDACQPSLHRLAELRICLAGSPHAETIRL